MGDKANYRKVDGTINAVERAWMSTKLKILENVVVAKWSGQTRIG